MSEAQLVSAGTIAWIGAGLGLVFGAVGARTNFCTMGAIGDIVNMGSWTRMRSWLFAIALAIVLTGALQLGGVVDVGKSVYTAPRLAWLSHAVGGLLFGVGMTLAGGCGSKTLIRLGGGNLKAVVVFLIVAIAAYMSMKGLFAIWRTALLDPVAVDLSAPQDLPSLLARWLGVDRRNALIALMAISGIGLGGFALSGRAFRRTDPLLAGIVTGLVIVAGWYATGHIGYVAEHPETLQEAFIGTNSARAESLSFIAPYAYATELLMMWSDKSRIVTFGIALVPGVIIGSALHALATGRFRAEVFRDPADFGRHAIGAVLMGFGGVTALGCSIGQGITGLSTLSLGSLISFAAIVVGSVATVKWEYWRAMHE